MLCKRILRAKLTKVVESGSEGDQSKNKIGSLEPTLKNSAHKASKSIMEYSYKEGNPISIQKRHNKTN
jgi:hypothetical protein